jgi:phosphoribosylglycinamide formyltransferase 1
MLSIVILISGRGSNMEAILRAQVGVDVRAVISNRPQAAGLAVARSLGVATAVVDHTLFAERANFDDALAEAILPFAPDYVVLAGFMRVLSSQFVARFANRILNIHPSLLPLFPGLNTHEQALAAGVKIHGASVHLVNDSLDGGAILAQAAVPVLPGDDAATLGARVLVQEHQLYPTVLSALAASNGRLDLIDSADRRTVVQGTASRVEGTPTMVSEARYLRAPWE